MVCVYRRRRFPSWAIGIVTFVENRHFLGNFRPNSSTCKLLILLAWADGWVGPLTSKDRGRDNAFLSYQRGRWRALRYAASYSCSKPILPSAPFFHTYQT